MKNELLREVMELGGDIVDSGRFAAAKKVPHHSRDGNIAAHSLETSGYALQLTRWLKRHGIAVSEEDVVRACLLHDIGMTEDDVFQSPSRVKGQTHPVESARIAQEEFGANETQVEAILHHMWPFCCRTHPATAEGWIVTASDKWCSLNELRRFLVRAVRKQE